MFGEWDPATAAAIERAVDLVADELWRAEHPERNPTRLEATSVQFRRAEAVTEIARRVIAGTVTETPDMTDADGATVRADDGTAPTDGAVVAAAPAGSVRVPVRSKRVTANASRGRAVVAVSVLIDYQTLAGALAANGSCELFDGTPISPDTVRRLACDAAIIPMVLGSRGEVLNQGRRIYLPTVAQRHAVAIRDRHCAFPGCRRPAKWTDVHHIVAFRPGCSSGGRTDLDNLLLLCDKHHHLVHEGHWKLHGTAFDFTVYRPDGTLFDHITRGPP